MIVFNAATGQRAGSAGRQGVARRSNPIGRIVGNHNVQGYLYIAPWLFGFIVFGLKPLIELIYHSFTKYNLYLPPQWVGPKNYQDILTNDPIFGQVAQNMLIYVIGATIVSIVVALFFATLLARDFRGNHVFRIIIYVPSLLIGTATGALFKQVFRGDENGLANMFLHLFGVGPVNWITNYDQPVFVLVPLILVNLWFIGGGMIIFLAGIKSIPPSLYEAAQMDGAGAWRCFRTVTLPLLAPVIIFNTIMTLIGHLQVFETPLIFATSGGMTGTDVLGYHYNLAFFLTYLYRVAFIDGDFGYGSALAVIIFAAALILTVIVLWVGRRYTYYGQQLAEAE